MKAVLIITVFLLGLLGLTQLLSLTLISSLLFVFTTLLILQGAFSTYGLLYSWFIDKDLTHLKPDMETLSTIKSKFTLIIPARFEEKVIQDTLRAMAKINYPKQLFEVIVVIRNDDTGTINKVRELLPELNGTDIKLITYAGYPVNKARALNEGLLHATGDFIGVFDAEDEPHMDIVTAVNSTFSKRKVDVVQSAVQLVTVNASWFAPLNVLEYYYWFKSVIPMFSDLGATPLGGNTVFFARSVLQSIGGWDDTKLTEDADIGMRLSAAGYKITAINDVRIATLEETPANLNSFIKQRSRWNRGYFQILFSGIWTKLPTLKQQLLALYVILQPVIYHFSLIGFVILPTLALNSRVPFMLTLYSFIPLYFLIIHIILMLIGLYEFKYSYQIASSAMIYILLLIVYFPYQLVLAYSSLRGGIQILLGDNNWEKTEHYNTHRLQQYYIE
ncbi:glycosyl transferase family 2 [Candidatus Roizmanbacteria bacterium CG22_combo_CG10-13_8_21_14_all_38_20]|uniref:Glycosyl transferase family 2 n=1 Tax=Candidatus Roizmanbacteria bacterium CG22_combo_CG10-13_8_21_14_all_38_20 TaxID=1974862 RepID=A0A2H0BU98_9BACT|nr:glycosyltransferase [Candidatus Microgenomates bacterium]PIP61184.1 MAG: glycosyl transferase family 2 [Candidatus Roizmanbacteria bacterium CG22_combo_CG10-13_8_21_14_all_38_20]PJC31174.1 MAG: glycosyl transferase family 2 [Candidatus Roizmanbacteria bacterium CG_4_9_14_0_2_um_filter_38_17]